MRILITGDDGFIGKNLVESFFENDSGTIIGLSKKTLASNEVNLQYTRYNADLNDIYSLYKILDKERPDWIINLGAEADVSKSYEYPYDFLKVNLVGVFNLLEWLRYNNKTKMLHFSTDEVFGEPKTPSKETDRPNPLNPYSASKASAEMYINAYSNCFEVDARIIRPFNIFGKYQKNNRLFAKIITNALSDNEFTLFRDSSDHKRGWIYAKNIYYAIKLIMEKGKPNESYNMKYDNYLSVEDIKNFEARCFSGFQSLKIGLIDQVGTLHDVIKKISEMVSDKQKKSFEQVAFINTDNVAFATFDLNE